MRSIAFEPDFAGWQKAAREALVQNLSPSETLWQPRDAGGVLDLFDHSEEGSLRELSMADPSPPRFRVPAEFMATAKLIACHRDQGRWGLLYRVLWRLTHGEAHLLEVSPDPDVIAWEAWSKAIRRDVHKMRAFVRFRETRIEGEQPWFVAWFEPHHLIVELNAPFFVDRFAAMNWSILTPDRCVHWDRKNLTFTPGVTRDQAPVGDVTEELWGTYYRNIFNPARVKIGAMKKEMAPHYWRNLPESKLIPELIATAPKRVAKMQSASRAKQPAADVHGPAPVPDTSVLEKVRKAAEACRACPLWKNATQVVFGEGSVRAKVMVVGEQPGDQEDLAGKPFIGPAGKLFDRALEEAGVDRDKLYVTNAVKHFKWEPRGKRRLHQKPNAREIAACRPWLEKEIELLKPGLIVCLGSTAAHSVVGAGIKVTEERGNTLPTGFGIPALVTVHPSSLLRQPDRSRADEDFKAFVADMKKINRVLAE